MCNGELAKLLHPRASVLLLIQQPIHLSEVFGTKGRVAQTQHDVANVLMHETGTVQTESARVILDVIGVLSALLQDACHRLALVPLALAGGHTKIHLTVPLHERAAHLLGKLRAACLRPGVCNQLTVELLASSRFRWLLLLQALHRDLELALNSRFGLRRRQHGLCHVAERAHAQHV